MSHLILIFLSFCLSGVYTICPFGTCNATAPICSLDGCFPCTSSVQCYVESIVSPICNNGRCFACNSDSDCLALSPDWKWTCKTGMCLNEAKPYVKYNYNPIIVTSILFFAYYAFTVAMIGVASFRPTVVFNASGKTQSGFSSEMSSVSHH